MYGYVYFIVTPFNIWCQTTRFCKIHLDITGTVHVWHYYIMYGRGSFLKKGRRKCCKLLWWWLAFTNTDSFFLSSRLMALLAISEGTIKSHPPFPSAPPRKEERNVTWKIGHKYGNLLSVMGCRKTQRKTGFGFVFCRQKTLSIKDERQSGPDSLKKESNAMSRESYDFQSKTS